MQKSKKIIKWRALYKELEYAPTTYTSRKLPTKYEVEILELLSFIDKWVESIKSK